MTQLTSDQLQYPEFINTLFHTFHQYNYQIYIVGGAVRDLYLNRPVRDWDFTTNATPDQIQELFTDTFYDNAFGTVGIVNPEDKQKQETGELDQVPVYEVTTFRTEQSYTDNRRPDKVEWGSSLQEDLQRRDFTISAMALEPIFNQDIITHFQLHDPFDGFQDLQQHIIKAVGEPQERFNEDALRMLRAIRLASQLGFTIDPETFKAIRQHASKLQSISGERIRDELFKILSSSHAAEAINILTTADLLQYILPELLKSQDVEQSGHHQDDVWTHSIKSLDHLENTDPIVRLATLIHDIGKPYTRAFVCPNCQKYWKPDVEEKILSTAQVLCPSCQQIINYRDAVVFHNHEMAGAKIAKNVAERLMLSKKQSQKLHKLVRWHMFSVSEDQTEKAIRRFIRNVGVENLDDIIDLRTADRLGSGAPETSWRTERFKNLLIEVQKQPFTVQDLKISGTEVMNILQIPPSRRVGEVLNALFEKVENKELENKPEILTQEVEKMKQ